MGDPSEVVLQRSPHPQCLPQSTRGGLHLIQIVTRCTSLQKRGRPNNYVDLSPCGQEDPPPRGVGWGSLPYEESNPLRHLGPNVSNPGHNPTKRPGKPHTVAYEISTS